MRLVTAVATKTYNGSQQTAAARSPNNAESVIRENIRIDRRSVVVKLISLAPL